MNPLQHIIVMVTPPTSMSHGMYVYIACSDTTNLETGLSADYMSITPAITFPSTDSNADRLLFNLHLFSGAVFSNWTKAASSYAAADFDYCQKALNQAE